MKIMFRVDASIQMGAGHVMRCLVLADHLEKQGHQCIFLSRSHPGHLNDLIASKGYRVASAELDTVYDNSKGQLDWNMHAHWLGVALQSDAQQTRLVLERERPDWLVIDHYAIESSWENIVSSHVGKIMVIDDLVDREHYCDVLLDQTFGRKISEYSGMVPKHCKVFTGVKYSLLRDEFAQRRAESLLRRDNGRIKNIFVSMGRMDKDNYTSIVLEKLKNCQFEGDIVVKVVLGANAPWLSDVKSIVANMPWETILEIDVKSMADLMVEADLAIGAAGTTSWERCALGLPSILIVTAENQRSIAKNLESVGAVKVLDCLDNLPMLIKTAPSWLSEVSHKCKTITDGHGIDNLLIEMENLW
tara:strand:- start:304 stop:1383 length:1080 start_codon:yes stop_codon:yes gene_type:complete